VDIHIFIYPSCADAVGMAAIRGNKTQDDCLDTLIQPLKGSNANVR
jgi:hypothetical protein